MTKRRILIVNANAVAAGELEERLTKLGYEVAGLAASEAAAIAMLEEATGDDQAAPVIVATDTMLPATDRELRAEVQVVICRHDAADAVHELEDRFFTTSIDLLCFLDFSGYFKRLNPAWEHTLGFTREELMSRPFIEFVHPDDRERTLRQNANVRAGGKALSFQNRYLCKDGSFKWLHWNAAPDSSQKVIYSLARDITANKLAEEEREQLLQKLQAALAEVKTLKEILPICSYCRKIRDDKNEWQTIEEYIGTHTTSLFSHGICPSCLETHADS
jgi:PAS domain S-box-containing protein